MPLIVSDYFECLNNKTLSTTTPIGDNLLAYNLGLFTYLFMLAFLQSQLT